MNIKKFIKKAIKNLSIKSSELFTMDADGKMISPLGSFNQITQSYVKTNSRIHLHKNFRIIYYGGSIIGGIVCLLSTEIAD